MPINEENLKLECKYFQTQKLAEHVQGNRSFRIIEAKESSVENETVKSPSSFFCLVRKSAYENYASLQVSDYFAAK